MASVDVDDTMQNTDFSEATSRALRVKVMQRLQDGGKAEDLKRCWQELPGIESATTVYELFAVYERANGVLTIQALKEVLKILGCIHLISEIQESRYASPMVLRESGIKKDEETVRKSTPPPVCLEHSKKFKHNSKKPIGMCNTTRQEQRKEDAWKFSMQHLDLPALSQVCQNESKETNKKEQRYAGQGLVSNFQAAGTTLNVPVLAPAGLVAANTLDGMSSGQFDVPKDVASSDEDSGTILASKLEKNQNDSDPKASVRPDTSSQMDGISACSSSPVPSASDNNDGWSRRDSIDDAESLAKHASSYRHTTVTMSRSHDSSEDNASSSDAERVQPDDGSARPSGQLEQGDERADLLVSGDETVSLMADRRNARSPVTTESDSSGAENPAIVTGRMPSEHMDYSSSLQGLVDDLIKEKDEQQRNIVFLTQRLRELTEENSAVHQLQQQLEQKLDDAHQIREEQGERLRQALEQCQQQQHLGTVNVALQEHCSNLKKALERSTKQNQERQKLLNEYIARNQELRDLNDVIPTLVNNVVLANQQRQDAETELTERTQEMDALMRIGMAASETDRVKLEQERRKAAESMKRRFCYLACLVCLIFSVFLAWLSLEPD